MPAFMPKRDADHHFNDSVSDSSKESGSASESETKREPVDHPPSPEKAKAADLEDPPEAPAPTARADRKSVGPSATSKNRYGTVSSRGELLRRPLARTARSRKVRMARTKRLGLDRALRA